MINKLIKFGAEWCGPCKVMDATLKEFTEKTGIPVEHYDVEENSELATEYKIRNIPATIFMKDDVIVDKKIGAMTLFQLMEHIKKLNEEE